MMMYYRQIGPEITLFYYLILINFELIFLS